MAGRPKDPEAVEIGRRLRATRQALGYTTVRSIHRVTQPEIPENNITKWENGEAKPSRAYVRFLKDRHGVTFDWVHDGDLKGLPFELATKLQEM